MGITKDKDIGTSSEAKLRGHAEKRLLVKKTPLQLPRSENDAKRLVHELEVHQIELEMQNAELKRAQEELESSRNKYVELYDFAPVGYFTVDQKGMILEVNLTGTKLLGIERRGLIHKPFISFIADADSMDIFAKHTQALHQKPDSQTCEIRLKRKDSGIVQAQIQSIAKVTGDGDSREIYTTIIDITERKEIERMVLAREERYRSYIEVTGQLAWTTNPRGEVAGDIPAWRKFTGQSEDDVQGTGWSKAVHPEDIRHTLETWKKAVTTKSAYEVEYRIRRYDGVYRHFLVRGVPVFRKDGSLREWVGTCIDITERNIIEAAMKENDQRLNRAQEIAHLGSWEMDLQTGRIIWSDETYRIFGVPPQEVEPTYETFLGVVHPDDRAAVDSAFTSSVHEDRNTYEIEHRVVRKSTGEVRTVRERCEHIRDASGRIIRSVGMVHDVTEHKKAEEKIEHLASFPELNPNPVIETDLQGQVIYCNEATTKMLEKLNLSTDDVRLLLPHDLTEVINQQEQEQEQEQDGRYAVREIEVNGRTFIESIIVPAHLKVVRIYAQDITLRKQAETALKKAHDELETMVAERTVELSTALAEIGDMKDRLEAENIYFRDERKMKHQFDNIIGESDGLKYVLYRAQQVVPANTTVLILGETGTGKELVAAAIHSMSPRKERPLITVNCAALPANLIESELFGREKGAFTGADTRRMGRFEVANGSTICLDEIGELPLELQIKLLRVIQHNEFERLGSSQTMKVDVRIVATTNRDLEKEVLAGRFRQDLYYRLNVFPITVPPLRQRKDDIPLMVQAFIDRYSRKMGKHIKTISKDTMATLQDYSWPGNVRELESIIERAVILCPGPVFHLADQLDCSSPAYTTAARTMEETERNQILKILSETRWRIEGKDGAAAILGLNASTLRARMHKLGVLRPRFKK